MMVHKSCLCVTTPTSGTGSLWRILTTIGQHDYQPVKISEQFEQSGRGSDLASWEPAANGFLYLYNTPHIVNAYITDPNTKIILNFRDPRDLACNQYHWVFQHPTNKSEQETAEYRSAVLAAGIDQFVLNSNNSILFSSIRHLWGRLQSNDPNVLVLSYNQLCLDFDNMLERIIKFLEVDPASVDRAQLELERTDNLKGNPRWVGQMWTGTDTLPGRYKRELTSDTIKILDEKYAQDLKVLRAFELPKFRALLATKAEEDEMNRVLVGKNGFLFLTRDANDTVGQITGQKKLHNLDIYKAAFAHLERRIFGKTVANFDYGHAIIPSKEVVLKKFLPEEVIFEEFGPRPVRHYQDAARTIWDPFYKPELLENMATAKEAYYPLTDSHWNHAGALRYTRAFLESVDSSLALALDRIEKKTFPAQQQGDLGIKLEMRKDEIEIVAPVRQQAKLVFENKIANEGSIRWFRNPEKLGKRAFILHDGFTLWLMGFLPEIFEEAFFFHGTIFDYDFVKEFNPTTVLSIHAERFFVHVPETGGNMFEAIGRQESLKKTEHPFANAWADRSVYSS